ncbi:MAG: hypothetical protein ACOX22_06760 [Caldicoprobacterales bacterium]|nr:hypothetical protein [Clostridiales bacterium]
MFISRNSIWKWIMAAILILLMTAISVWTVIGRQANQDRKYSGAKYVEAVESSSGGRVDG